VKNLLLKYNSGASLVSTKMAILMDATASMSSLLTQAKNTVNDMFSRISSILDDNKKDPTSFQLQFIAYRNYNAPDSELLKCSGWCDDPIILNNFLSKISPNYGWGNEAIEVALSYINKDDNVSEVIIIGDSCANTREEVIEKRKSGQNGGEQYWKNTKFNNPTYFEDELELLKKEKY